MRLQFDGSRAVFYIIMCSDVCCLTLYFIIVLHQHTIKKCCYTGFSFYCAVLIKSWLNPENGVIKAMVEIVD